MEDVVAIQEAAEKADWHQPTDLKRQLDLVGLPSDVNQSLLTMLAEEEEGDGFEVMKIAKSAVKRAKSFYRVIPMKDHFKSPPTTRAELFGEDFDRDSHKARLGVNDNPSQSFVLLCEPTDHLNYLLEHIEDWQYDTFALNKETDGHALSYLAFVLIKRNRSFVKYGMDEGKLARFLMEIEARYSSDTSLDGMRYHCATHAADVLRSLHVLGSQGGIFAQSHMTETDVLSMYLAAVMHDFEHKGEQPLGILPGCRTFLCDRSSNPNLSPFHAEGVNNDYLVRTASPLAIIYNDHSPMENHHCASAWTLLCKNNFLGDKMPAKLSEKLRKQVIEMILATDMKQHFAITSQFQIKASRISSIASSLGGAEENGALEKPGWDQDGGLLAMQMTLKWADIGHLSAPIDVHLKWVNLLEEEMFAQVCTWHSHGHIDFS